MDPVRRQAALRLLMEPPPQCHATSAPTRAERLRTCREVEAAVHAASGTDEEYCDRMQRTLFHARETPDVLWRPHELVYAPEEVLLKGTTLERVDAARNLRERRFQQMLQEKYDALDDQQFHALVRCRRCGSAEVTWEEKQTRSADEAATLFCVCGSCRNRWVMR